MKSPVYNIVAIPIEDIQANSYNPNHVAPPEMKLLYESIKADGYTIVPVRLYFRGNHAKLEIALAKGKKLYDKRETIAKKDQRREAERDYKISKMY